MDRAERMAAASALMREIAATRRDDPPPEIEAGAWTLTFEDIEDERGRIVERGRRRWIRADLFERWNRLRFEAGAGAGPVNPAP